MQASAVRLRPPLLNYATFIGPVIIKESNISLRWPRPLHNTSSLGRRSSPLRKRLCTRLRRQHHQPNSSHQHRDRHQTHKQNSSIASSANSTTTLPLQSGNLPPPWHLQPRQHRLHRQETNRRL